MPDKETPERAEEDKREGKSPSTQAGEFVREEISRRQAWRPLDQTGDRDRVVEGPPRWRRARRPEGGDCVEGNPAQGFERRPSRQEPPPSFPDPRPRHPQGPEARGTPSRFEEIALPSSPIRGGPPLEGLPFARRQESRRDSKEEVGPSQRRRKARSAIFLTRIGTTATAIRERGLFASEATRSGCRTIRPTASRSCRDRFANLRRLFRARTIATAAPAARIATPAAIAVMPGLARGERRACRRRSSSATTSDSRSRLAAISLSSFLKSCSEGSLVVDAGRSDATRSGSSPTASSP